MKKSSEIDEYNKERLAEIKQEILNFFEKLPKYGCISIIILVVLFFLFLLITGEIHISSNAIIIILLILILLK